MWIEAGTNHWTWNADDARHLLLKIGNVYVELHDDWLHTYLGGPGDHLVPAPNGDGWHLSEAVTHQGTIQDPTLMDLTDEQVWQAMARRQVAPIDLG